MSIMGSLPVVVSLILLVLATTGVSTLNSGLQIRILQNGLNMAARAATDRLADKINNKNLPDVTGSSGKTSYSASKLVVTSFQKNGSSVTIRPGPGLTWTASNGALRIQGDWGFKTKILFVPFSDSGRFIISASGISFSISVKMGKDSSGRPTVWSTGCTSSISGVSVRISGSPISFVYNLLKGYISKKLKGEAEKVMCEAAQKAITEDVKTKLSEVDVMTNIGTEMVLDYRLVQDPVFGIGYLQSNHKGEFRAKLRPATFNSQPAPFPSAAGAPSRMVNVWLSDYIINSFAFSAFNLGMAQYNLTEQDILPGNQQYLKTSCSAPAICLGTFLPGVSVKYPNSKVVLNLKANSVPFIKTTRTGMKLTLPGEMGLYVPTAAGQLDMLFKFSVQITTTVSIWVDDHSVHGEVVSLSAQFHATDSDTGPICDNVIQALFNQFVKPVIMKKLNEVGLKGIDIPHVKGTKFTRPVLVLNEGSLLLATDVALTIHKGMSG